MAVIGKEVLKGLSHLYDNHVAHLDLKPENILLGLSATTLSVKLCDFGLCSIVTPTSSSVTEFCGSPGFFAPEAFLQKKFWYVFGFHLPMNSFSLCSGFKADVFSFACVLLELLVSQVR